VLALRAWARACLWSASEFENIPSAVDPLQAFAIESDLVAEIGQDAVQQILSETFAPFRYQATDGSADDNALFCDICFFAPCFTPGFCSLCREDEGRRLQAPVASPKPKKRPTPQTTIGAIMWCVRERGPQALQEQENIERLGRCDDAAISEIERRLSKWETA
jgi:hypothetical protein